MLQQSKILEVINKLELISEKLSKQFTITQPNNDQLNKITDILNRLNSKNIHITNRKEIITPPTIINNTKQKIIFKSNLCPGDTLMMAYAINCFMKQYKDNYIVDIRTPSNAIFENNPYITKLADNDPEVKLIELGYPSIHKSNEYPVHFIHGYLRDIEDKLKLKIDINTKWNEIIYISEQEKSWFSQIRDIIGSDIPYIVINAGYKNDYTAKYWGYNNWQKLVDLLPNITFVQVGENSPSHKHTPLKGTNVINLIGKTNLRQLIRLVYHSYGVVTPVSMLQILAYAVPAHPRFNRENRLSICIAGGREPASTWHAAPSQIILHTCGMLKCCSKGGCWKSRIVKLNDGDSKDNSLCLDPITTDEGEIIPKCMNMITPEEISKLIINYMNNL